MPDIVKLLYSMMEHGVLYIITNVPTEGRSISELTPEESLRPSSFVCHKVTSLDGPDEEGIMTAYTSEGDWCRGKPEALYTRLTEYYRDITSTTDKRE